MFDLISVADVGQSTAEYGVGIVGAAGIGAVLIQLGHGDWFIGVVQSIIRQALVASNTLPLPSLRF